MGLMSDAFKNWFHGRANHIIHIHGTMFYILTLNSNLKWFHRFPNAYPRTIITKVTRFFYEFDFPLRLFRILFISNSSNATKKEILKSSCYCSTHTPPSVPIVFQQCLRVPNVESMPSVWKVHYTWVHMISIWIFQFSFLSSSNIDCYLSNGRRHMTVIGMPKLDFALHVKKNVKYYWQ